MRVEPSVFPFPIVLNVFWWKWENLDQLHISLQASNHNLLPWTIDLSFCDIWSFFLNKRTFLPTYPASTFITVSDLWLNINSFKHPSCSQLRSKIFRRSWGKISKYADQSSVDSTWGDMRKFQEKDLKKSLSTHWYLYTYFKCQN